MLVYSKYMSVSGIIVYVFLEVFVVKAVLEGEDDWVDPFDMLNYDRYSKTMLRNDRNTQGPEKHNHDLITCEDSLRSCEKSLMEMKINTSKSNGSRLAEGTCISNCSVPKQQHQNSPNNNAEAEYRMYMRRFVNILMEAAGMKYVTMQELTVKEFEFQISLTNEQLALLRKFGSNEGDVSLQTLDDIFSNVLKSKPKWVPENVLSWMDKLFFSNFSLEQIGYYALMLAVPLLTILMMFKGFSPFAIVGQCVLMIFVIGFIVTYNRLHKVAEIRSYVYQKKYSDVPKQCRLASPSEMNWYQWLFSSNSYSDQKICQEYYEALWMDPSLHVSADIVLAEMLAKFFSHPVDHVSNAIVRFSNTVLGGLPFGTNWIVLLLSLFMFIALMVLVFGLVTGGQANFFGLHVGFSRRQPNTIQNTQQATPEAISPDRSAQNGHTLPVTAPPVFNININLPRRLSFGKPEGFIDSGSSAVLKLTNTETSDNCTNSSKPGGDISVPSEVQGSEIVTAANSSSVSKDIPAVDSATSTLSAASFTINKLGGAGDVNDENT